jgi:hypothetical protein
VAAIELARRDYEVTVIEAGPHLGGILHAHEWDGLHIDNGCHLLDFIDVESGRLYQDILGDDMHPVSRRYASINRGKISDGIAVPDMARFDPVERDAALADILDATKNDRNAELDNLADSLIHRYGKAAGTYMASCAQKMTAIDPKELSPMALTSLPVLERLRIGDDVQMAQLKKEPRLDERLAVSSQNNPMQFAPDENPFKVRNQYPSHKGMTGLCDAALKHLRAIGCTVLLDSPITGLAEDELDVEFTIGGNKPTMLKANYCYWSLPSARIFPLFSQTNPGAGGKRPLSMINFAFKVQADRITDMTYVHDFSSETLAYRHSTPGRYGNQTTTEGYSYICIEVPCSQTDEIWNDPLSVSDQLWSEAINAGVVLPGSEYAGVREYKIPVGLMLPVHSSEAKLVEERRTLHAYEKRFIFGDARAFGKSAIVHSVRMDLDQLGG